MDEDSARSREDARNHSRHGAITRPQALDRQNANIFQSFENLCVAVLVTDMSGFTRLTKKHGIVHLASVIVRFRQICLPILHKFSAHHISTEADNFIVVFQSAREAVMAAQDILCGVAIHNASLHPGRPHFAINLNGIGIDFGQGPIVDFAGKLFGRTFSNAYMIGEELSAGGRILFSERVKAELDGKPGVVIGECHVKDFTDDPIARQNAEELGAIYEIVGQGNATTVTIPSVHDDTYIGESLLPLALRHDAELSDADMSALDSRISGGRIHEKTVLMFDLEYADTQDPYEQMFLKSGVVSRIREMLQQYAGEEIEDELLFFDDPVNAVLFAVACQSEFCCLPEHDQGVTMKGLGIHCGTVLHIPGTDVHWGDPVNMASKLGQDTARSGMMYISLEVFEAVRLDPRTANLHFRRSSFVKSGVTLECRIVESLAHANRLKRMVMERLETAGILGPRRALERAQCEKLICKLDPTFPRNALDWVLDEATGADGFVDVAAFLDLALSSYKKHSCRHGASCA